MKSFGATEETMAKRRLERLDRLNFFMRDPRMPQSARDMFGLMNTHILLRGWFQNSYWRTAWWCTKKAASHSWMNFCIACEFFYWRHILRLTQEQIHERMGRLSE